MLSNDISSAVSFDLDSQFYKKFSSACVALASLFLPLHSLFTMLRFDHGGLRRRNVMHDDASWCQPHVQKPPLLQEEEEEEEFRFMLASCVTLKVQG